MTPREFRSIADFIVPMLLAFGVLMAFTGCATTKAALAADEKRAVDCLQEVEPAALQAAQMRIISIVASGATKDAAVAGIEAYAVDELPALVGCAAFSISISDQATASAVAAQYIAAHGLTFTATPKGP